MSLTRDDWVALREKRATITAALHSLGVPHDGWINERPAFKEGYNPNWEEIEKIALTVDIIPPPKPKPTKPVAKPKGVKATPKKAPTKKGAK